MHIIIVGGGGVGYQLALLLEASRQPFTVKLIEKDEKRCEELSKEYRRLLIRLAHSSHGVEHGQQGHADVGEDRFPH